MANGTTSKGGIFGGYIDEKLSGVYDFAYFVGMFFVEVVRLRYPLTEVIRRFYDVGVLTLPLILLTGAITGIVFTQQSRPSLAAFGATAWLPSLVVLGLVRSLAPLVTALICAGKVGSSIGAEIGSMKVTEQLEAMEVSAVRPFAFLVVTRTLATTFMVPALTVAFAATGFLGSYINIRAVDGISWAAFVSEGFGSLEVLDLAASLSRALIFGFTIGIIACYRGFNTSRGTEGVGRAANGAVVGSMLAVFLEEILIVQVVTLIRSL